VVSDLDLPASAFFPAPCLDPDLTPLVMEAAEALHTAQAGEAMDDSAWIIEVVQDCGERTQMVFLEVDEGLPYRPYVLDGEARLLRVRSNVGLLSSTIEVEDVLRRASNMVFCHAALVEQPEGPPMIQIRGAVPVQGLGAAELAALVEEAGAFADALERDNFGSDQD
jgi:hypothetical protein